VRRLIQEAYPGIEETIKWGLPAFEHAGIVAMMAAFKRHAAFGFRNEALIRRKLGRDAARVFPKDVALGMGGRRYLTRAELPPDTAILRAVKIAVALNDAGARPVRERKRKPPAKAPPYLLAALKRNAKSRRTYLALTPAQQREYIEWLTEAKQEATRARRLATTIKWLAAGKRRNWQYQNC